MKQCVFISLWMPKEEEVLIKENIAYRISHLFSLMVKIQVMEFWDWLPQKMEIHL